MPVSRRTVCRALGGMLVALACAVAAPSSVSAAAQNDRVCETGTGAVDPKVIARLRQGLNLTGWDREKAERRPQTAALQALREAGLTHIRLPVDDRELVAYDGEGLIENTGYLERLGAEIDRLTGLGFAVSVDLHPGPGIHQLLEADPELALTVLQAIWDDLATVIRHRDPSLVYAELLNEPPTTADLWSNLQPRLAGFVRERLPDHPIVLAPAGPQRHETLFAMTPLDDPNTVYAVHYYDPFIFTHQGASWDTSHPLLARMKDLPFPARPGDDRVEAIADMLRQSGDEAEAERFETIVAASPDARAIADVFSRIAAWSAENDRPVIVNEFGVYREHAPIDARRDWLAAVTRAARSNCIGWTHWEYADGFGLIDFQTGMPEEGIMDALLGRAGRS